MVPAVRLRQIREKLGLTYRDVEEASYKVASQHGRPEFILRISRLADIENRGVTPGLHKLYSLCVIYHLDFLEVSRWYEVPFEQLFHDSGACLAPNTHLAAAPRAMRLPARFDPSFNPQHTSYLTRMVESWKQFEGAVLDAHTRFRYGYIGLGDRRMAPLLRPGSLVLIDPKRRQVEQGSWQNEFERPIYFIEIRDGYRCSWCQVTGGRLVLQPHPLSACVPEVLRMPEEAEVMGQVTGVVMRLVDP